MYEGQLVGQSTWLALHRRVRGTEVQMMRAKQTDRARFYRCVWDWACDGEVSGMGMMCEAHQK